MLINVHLDKDEITTALKEYLERNDFLVEKNPLIQLKIEKGDAREQEIWDATISGCNPINSKLSKP